MKEREFRCELFFCDRRFVNYRNEIRVKYLILTNIL